MNNIKEIIESIEKATEENNKKIDIFREEMKKKFNELFNFVFEHFPIQAIMWEQYTPYFNDGDECVFRINSSLFIIEGFDKENIESHMYDYENEKYNQVLILNVHDYKKYIENPICTNANFFQSKIDKYNKQEEKYPGIAAICENIDKIINKNTDLMKIIFGNHVFVILTKDETFINRCEHD